MPQRLTHPEISSQRLLSRVLAPPFTLTDPGAQAARRLGLTRVVDWLALQPGQTWPERWMASGADAMGNAAWWQLPVGWLRPGEAPPGVSFTSNLRVCVVLLVAADVIRPSLDWILTPEPPRPWWGR